MPGHYSIARSVSVGVFRHTRHPALASLAKLAQDAPSAREKRCELSLAREARDVSFAHLQEKRCACVHAPKALLL